MNYRLKIFRNDNIDLNLQFDELEQAKKIAKKYEENQGYDTEIVESKVIYQRKTKRVVANE